jgi:ABC-type multidrug transport system fused ATPase/permease subunit
VLDALGAAAADDLLGRLPAGLDTVIGDGGRSLSSGERQRIALARAFLREASLVVLDEPTANLDPETAASVDDAIVRLTSGVTSLAIVHRPALVARAERVVSLANGRIVDDERHRQDAVGSANHAALAAAATP